MGDVVFHERGMMFAEYSDGLSFGEIDGLLDEVRHQNTELFARCGLIEKGSGTTILSWIESLYWFDHD